MKLDKAKADGVPNNAFKYIPFGNVQKLMKAIQAHGWWLKHKKRYFKLAITGLDGDGCLLGNAEYYRFGALFSDFVFASDGSPCGELVKE